MALGGELSDPGSGAFSGSNASRRAWAFALPICRLDAVRAKVAITSVARRRFRWINDTIVLLGLLPFGFLCAFLGFCGFSFGWASAGS